MKKRIGIFITILMMSVLCVTVFAQSVVKMDGGSINVKSWIKNNFSKGKVPPFSFEYGGDSSKNFITKWTYSARQTDSDDPNVVRYVYTYKDPKSLLVVECDVKGYLDSEAVEWVLRFRNEGSENSKPISKVDVSDIVFNHKAGDTNVYYAKGTNDAKDDFAPLFKSVSVGENLYMEPRGGRSSDTAFPFFNMELPGSQGVVVAIGWSGTWFSDITGITPNEVSLVSGLPKFDAYIYPGEDIRTPSVCLLFWQSDDRMTGHNRFRQFLLSHKCRRIDGKLVQYPFCKGFNWGDPYPCNEYTCLTEDYALALVHRFKQFDIFPEAFWLDAGWYTDAGNVSAKKNWMNTVGNWSVDTTRFPNGFKPLSDEIHRLGAKFMVWFEPERVYNGTEWSVKHPEFIINVEGSPNGLMNLGDTAACAWVSKYIGDFLEENGIDYYRQDFNMAPAKYWTANDQEGRTGITEVKYIEGLYRYWDNLLARFPNMLIDNCASGGRRLDLETVSRSAPLWRTDYNYGEPNGYQCHTYGLHHFLPLHGTGCWAADKYVSRSSLGPAVTLNWKVTESSSNLVDMRSRTKEMEEIRPYFLKDFYPLTGIDSIASDCNWIAYQLNDPEADKGYVVAFRRQENREAKRIVKLSGLNPDKTYYVYNVDTGTEERRTGKELMNALELNLENPRSSVVIKYQSTPEDKTIYSTVGAPLENNVTSIGAEFDPHFLSQNVTRNDGSKVEDWDNVIARRVKDMNIQSFRVMVLPQWYEKDNDNDDPNLIEWSNFDFDTPEMRSLMKELDLAQQLGIRVTLTLWGAPSGHFLSGKNDGNWVVAPEDNEEWAENFSALIQYLVKKKGYTCVKEITPVNEPDWSYLIAGKRASTDKYIEMCETLDKRFKKDGIRDLVKFNLSDNSDGGIGTHKYLEACANGLKNVADVLNSHTYIFGYETPNSVIYDWEKENVELSKASGKPHVVGEFGGNQCVGAARQKDINLYERGVLMVRLATNFLNAGASAISYWSLIDQYYDKDASYDNMQQLGLWKHVKGVYANDTIYKDLKTDYEVRPQYYAYSLLSRFVRPGAKVYPVDTRDDFYAATAVKNSDGKWTYIFSNGSSEDKKVNLSNSFDSSDKPLKAYVYAKDKLPKDDSQIMPSEELSVTSADISLTIPAQSVILLSE